MLSSYLDKFPFLVAIRHLRLRGRLGRDGCQSALWDCFGGQFRRHNENASPKTVPQCTWPPSRPGLPRNLKVANALGLHREERGRLKFRPDPSLRRKSFWASSSRKLGREPKKKKKRKDGRGGGGGERRKRLPAKNPTILKNCVRPRTQLLIGSVLAVLIK